MDHTANIYIAVTLSSTSPYFSDPGALVSPPMKHEGQVGQLKEVQLVSVPKSEWDEKSEDILSFLKAKDGVSNVEVQVLKQRAKRDEL
ncbi:hypothetical protein C8J56DRAFT_950045 [Mycena floridula]|nr:hypothetical protein C8J56DRAFT_950045 [Mycena floridula]